MIREVGIHGELGNRQVDGARMQVHRLRPDDNHRAPLVAQGRRRARPRPRRRSEDHASPRILALAHPRHEGLGHRSDRARGWSADSAATWLSAAQGRPRSAVRSHTHVKGVRSATVPRCRSPESERSLDDRGVVHVHQQEPGRS